jgi:hypothetical protein
VRVQRLISATSFTVTLRSGLAACICIATVCASLNIGLQVIVNTSKAATLIMGVCLLKETANACASAGLVFSFFVQPSLTMDRNVFECCRSSNVCASAVAALLPSSNSRISLFINHQHLHLKKHGRPRLLAISGAAMFL